MNGRFVLGLALGLIIGALLMVKAQNFAYPVLPISQVIRSWSNPVSIDSDSDSKIDAQVVEDVWVNESGDTVDGNLIVMGQLETPKIVLDCNTICQLSQAQSGGEAIEICKWGCGSCSCPTGCVKVAEYYRTFSSAPSSAMLHGTCEGHVFKVRTSDLRNYYLDMLGGVVYSGVIGGGGVPVWVTVVSCGNGQVPHVCVCKC